MRGTAVLLTFASLLSQAAAGPVQDVQSCLAAMSAWNTTYGPLSGTPDDGKFSECTANPQNKYCMLSVQIPVKQLSFRVLQSLCLPDSCNVEAISGLCDGSIDCDNLPPEYESLQQACSAAQSLICKPLNEPQPINVQCAGNNEPSQTAYAKTLGGALSCAVPMTSASPFYQNLTAASSTGPNDLGDWDKCSTQSGARYCTCSYNIAPMVSVKTGQCVPEKCNDSQFGKSVEFVCDPYTDCLGSASFLNPTSCFLTKALACSGSQALKKFRDFLPGGGGNTGGGGMNSAVARRMSSSSSLPLSLKSLREYAESRGLTAKFEESVKEAAAFLGKRAVAALASPSLSASPSKEAGRKISPPAWTVLDTLLSIPPQGNLTDTLLKLNKLKDNLNDLDDSEIGDLGRGEAQREEREIEESLEAQKAKGKILETFRREGAVVPPLEEDAEEKALETAGAKAGEKRKPALGAVPDLGGGASFSSTCDFSKPPVDWRTAVSITLIVLFVATGLLALAFGYTIAQPGWDNPRKKNPAAEPESLALKVLAAFSPMRNWTALFRLSAPKEKQQERPSTSTTTQAQQPEQQQASERPLLEASGVEGGARELRNVAESSAESREAGKRDGGASSSSSSSSSPVEGENKKKEARPEMECLHGLRVLSLAWVIFGHTLIFWLTSVDVKNIEAVLKITQGFWYSLLTSAPFSVDSFFFLSGLLCTISLVPMFNAVKIPPIGLALLHRYLRLTPVYLLVIAIYYWVSVYLGDGPLWPSYIAATWGVSGSGSACGQYWWTNALYINNLYPTKVNDMCLAWSWYLANDMQFFLVALIVLALYTKVHKAIGWGLTGGLLVGCIIANAVITYDNSIGVAIFEQLGGGGPGGASFDLVYDKPWTRIGPYAVGMLLGLVILEGRIKLDKWNTALRMATHVFIAALFLFLIFIPWTANKVNPWKWPMWANVAYLMWDRSLWAVTLAWLVLAMLQGFAPWTNWILSWKAWAPLARMTYLAYLIHPVVMFVLFSNTKGQEYYTEPVQLILYFLGCWTATYIVSGLMTLLLEMPIANLEKLLVEGITAGMKKKIQNQHDETTDLRTARAEAGDAEVGGVGDSLTKEKKLNGNSLAVSQETAQSQAQQ